MKLFNPTGFLDDLGFCFVPYHIYIYIYIYSFLGIIFGLFSILSDLMKCILTLDVSAL